MKTAKARMIFDCLRRAVQPEGVGLTDGQLLRQYFAHRDEAAFAALVRRHGPMVLALCRRLLRRAEDAEDAFQAAFVVLARKGLRVAERQTIGGWLHGVAYHVALTVRKRGARRQTKERQVEMMPHPLVMPEEDQSELLAVLDRELTRLPEKYRLPVVLCELEGRSRKEAARQLGLPEGTLSSRLAAARKTLARRMAAHVPAVTGASLTALFASEAGAAVVPGPLVASTVRAAGGIVSAGVVALAEGVLKAMFLTKLKTWAVVLLTAGVLTFSAGTRFVPTAVGTAAGGEKEKTLQRADSATETESREVQVLITGPAGLKVYVLKAGGQGNTIAPIEAPGRINLEQGKRSRLKLADIPNCPGVKRFPTVEILKMDAATEPFVTNSAIPIEFTDEDFEHVSDGWGVTKVIYLTTGTKGTKTTVSPMGRMMGAPRPGMAVRPGEAEPDTEGPTTMSRLAGSMMGASRPGGAEPETQGLKTVGRLGMAGSGPGMPMGGAGLMSAQPCEEPGQVHAFDLWGFPPENIIEAARQRGTVLAIVRMGDIDLEKAGKATNVEMGDDSFQGRVLHAGKPIEIVIGDDGIQGRVEKGTTKGKANDNRADQPANQLEHIMRDLDTVRAENETLRQQLKAAEVQTRSLLDLLERTKREPAFNGEMGRHR